MNMWTDERYDVRLYLGDSMKILPTVFHCDHIITDPPYDARTHVGIRSSKGVEESNPVSLDFTSLDDPASLAVQLLDISDGWVIAFCAMEQIGEYARGAGEAWVRGGFWDKPNGAPQFSGDRPAVPGEAIAIMHGKHKKKVWNGGGKRGIWKYCIKHHDRCHPTQKPIDLMEALVSDFTSRNDIILDPFMGAGSTGVAAVRTGRGFIGIEQNPEYFGHAIRRIKEAIAWDQGGQLFADYNP